MKTVYRCIAAVIAAILLAGISLLIFPPKKARAQPIPTVHLLGEPCRLIEAVVNLPMRATWDTPDGKQIEGCWGRHRSSPSVYLTYWADKTVIGIPVEEVQPAGVKPSGLGI